MQRAHSLEDSDTEKDWGQEEKGATKDEMVGWHHWLNGHEFEQAQGDSEGWGSLACFSLRGRKESDTTERLNNNKNVMQNWSNVQNITLSLSPHTPPFPSLLSTPLSLPHFLFFLGSFLFPLLGIPLCFLYKKTGWVTLWDICQQLLGIPQLHALSQEFLLNGKEVSLFKDYTYGCSEPDKWLFPSQGVS